MSRRPLRSPQVLPVAALLAFALLAPVHGWASTPVRRADGLAETCVDALGSSGSDGSWSVNPGAGVTQPLGPTTGNIASFAFDFLPTGIDPRFPSNVLLSWDPARQAPDSTTVALRVGFPFTNTDGVQYTVAFAPPIVRACAPGVADPPGAYLAFDMSCARHTTTTIGLRIAFDGPSDVPALLQYTIGGGPRAPVPTAHPVSEFVICDGGDAVQGLELAQAVMTANASLDTSTDLVMQRFRVHVPIALRWLELALTTSATSLGPVEIYDGEGTGATPPPLLRPLGLTSLAAGPGLPCWVAGTDSTLARDLKADHDYWLCVHTGHACVLEARALTGGESPEFGQNIGPLYRTTTSDPDWQAIPDRALSFRVIGVALPTTSVPLAARTSAGPRLAVTPNPARGAVSVRWSGAVGALRLDLYDTRGRRVVRAEGGSGGAGEWRWNGLDEAGHTLPAGVYFVRGRDDAGRVASARVVRIP